MTRAPLDRLQQIAALQRDRDLAQLNRYAKARSETKDRIEALARPQPLVSDPALFTVRQAHLGWAMAQRLALNQTLARQTARLLDQKARTAKSVARADVLSQLTARLAQRRTHSP